MNTANKVKGYKDVALSDINKEYCEGIKKYLEILGLKQSTIYRYFKFLKTVVRYEYNESNTSNLSILNYKVKNEESIKYKLKGEEFELFKKIGLAENLALSRDVFVSLVYSWGARIGDMLMMQPSNIKEGRLDYFEQKTGKFKSILISEELSEILKKYKGQSPHYIFPYLTKAPGNPKTDPFYQKHLLLCL